MFVPRSVKRKFEHTHSPPLESQLQPPFKKQTLDSTEIRVDPTTTTTVAVTEPPVLADLDNDGPVKQFSSDQRPIVIGSDEPICVICGKYGEYVNDDTDHDVCSLQCKAIDTDMTFPAIITTTRRTRKDHPTYFTQPSVAENVHAKLTNYQEPPHLASMTPDQVGLMLKAHGVQVRGSGVPHPITSFDECRSVLSAPLLDNLDNEGWAMATAVQRLTVPTMLAGRDVFVVAPSGSGKTAAFAVPILAHCNSLSASHRHKRRAGPYALILAPTRDLCLQIESTLKRLARGVHNMRTALLVGGADMPLPDQLFRLRKGVQIVVGTPGRVAMIASEHPHLLRIWRMRMVVLDEADVLFEHQGLRKQVKEILDRHLPDRSRMRRQTAYFSTAVTDAQHTMKKACCRLVQPVDILVGQVNEKEETKAMKACPNVKQTVLWVENASKAKRLLSILDDPKYFSAPVLVFVESVLGAEHLRRTLLKRRKHEQWRVASVAADKSLEERKLIIDGMNADPPVWDVVIATDVMARGISFAHVRLVINYDMASSLADYVHRIGRATVPEALAQDRTQKRGRAISFVNNENKRLLPSLATFLASQSPVDVTPLPNELKQLL